MAASVVEQLLAGNLNPDDVVKWLSYQVNDFGLGANECQRSVFVPYYLNYIHDLFSVQNFKSKSKSKNDSSHEQKSESNRTEQTVLENSPKVFSPTSQQSDDISPVKQFRNYRRSTRTGSKHENSPGSVSSVNQQQAPNIEDLEAFPPIGSCKSKVRRITPTTVLSPSVKTLRVNQFSEAFGNQPDRRSSQRNKLIFSSTPLKERKDDNLKDARDWLREHKNKSLDQADAKSLRDPNTYVTNVLETAQSPTKSLLPEKTVLPDVQHTSSTDKLDAMVIVYSACLHENLVPNVNIEMYFLVQILTLKIKESMIIQEGHLGTVHNCVYFATKVLEKQTLLLKLFDSCAIKMLLGIAYLQKFSETLYKALVRFKTYPDQFSSWKISHIKGVPFLDGIDNRQNFPSAESFGIFRRQRDMFYDLFTEWQKRYLTNSSMTPDTFTRKVNMIVQLGRNPVNQIHLARLLISQLLQSCCDCEEFSLEGGVDEESLAELKQMFPEKFTKLDQRLSAPALQGNPSPVPSFQGVQGFFHDFFQYSDSAMLYRHAIDLLVVEIEEKNRSDVFDSDSELDQEDRERFFLTVHTLRLLGKFLGYLIFSPYQSNVVLPNQSAQELRQLRSNKVFQIDLQSILHEAVLQRRLILTIPWVVEFLSMSDNITLSLPSCQPVIDSLVQLYHNVLRTINNSYSRILLQLLLGYLFELPSFPHSAFFNYKPNDAKPLGENMVCLDELQLVDQKLITTCCPYVQAINCVLKQFSSANSSQTKEVRKITPVAADNHSKVFTQLSIQQKLEENFFHYQSASVKRTVDFVADRVASKQIKNISNVIIPSAKAKELEKIKTEHENTHKSGKMNAIIFSSSGKLCHSVLVECEKYIVEYGKTLVNELMPLLLADDCCKDVIDTCSEIACQFSSSKVRQWVFYNVTVDYFIGELNEEIPHLFKSKGNESSFADFQKNSDKYFDSIRALNDIILSLHNRDQVSKDRILSVVKLVQDCKLDNPQDVIHKNMSNFYADFITAVIIYCPASFDNETSEECIKVVRNFSDDSAMQRLISPRNLLLLNHVDNSSKSWSKVSETLSTLISNKLLDVDKFLSNCTKIVEQKSLSSDSSQCLFKCIQEVLSNVTEKDETKIESLRKMMENHHV